MVDRLKVGYPQAFCKSEIMLLIRMEIDIISLSFDEHPISKLKVQSIFDDGLE